MIEFRNVSKVYNNGTEALHNINLTVEKGEFVFIVGSSGAGKSTFLKLVMCEERPNSGQIIVDGVEISGYRKKQLVEYRREKIGFVFQFYNLIPSLTARENIETTIDIAVNPAIDKKELMDRLDITPFANRYPSELSGGQQQRVAIARAIAKNPALLLCDELTGALDSKSAREVLSFVEKVNQMYHTTVLIITHNETIQGFADVIIHVRDGKVTKQEKNPHKIPVSELEL